MHTTYQVYELGKMTQMHFLPTEEEEVHTLNSLAPRNMSCQITCFGAQGDKVSRLVSQKAKNKCGWKKASLHI